jgi:hypothetical protein
MFMRLVIALLGSFLLLGFVTAPDSYSEAEFNIAGCTFQFDGSFVGVSPESCSAGRNSNRNSYTGMFYCDDDGEDEYIGYITTDVGLGCSRGETTFNLGTPEGACCPTEFPFCKEVEDDLFQCQKRMADCDSFMGINDCVEGYGYYYNGECICERSAQSCDVYVNQSDCNNDDMNIGSVGDGRSKYCGSMVECGETTFSIPEDSCGCSWNLDAGGGCEHSFAVVEAFPGEFPTSFECSSSWDIGDCVDGARDVNWTSTTSGDTSGDIEICQDILGCNGGSEILACGENFVKLPGFSLFSLFMSLFVIGIYYFMLGRFKGKGSYAL